MTSDTTPGSEACANPPKTPTVLLVEDNEDDVFFMRRALKTAKLNVSLQILEDGRETLDYLAGAGKYADRAQYPFPTLVLLDLKLPYVHGFDVLAAIRNNPLLKGLTVIVLTSSPEEVDRKKAEELGAHGYRVKPPTAEMLREVAQLVSIYAEPS